MITHNHVSLCPRSIFRMFSSDRKRVETALENCNLPSGRVRHQNTETVSSCFPSLWTCSSPSVFAFLSHLQALLSLLSFHLSVLYHSAHFVFSWNCIWLLLCSFVWSLIFWMSAWLLTQNWFSLGSNETNEPSGSDRDDKSCFICTSVRHHEREAAPSCIEV